MNQQESHRPPVRVALVGLGRAMFADHYEVFRRNPSLFQVVAACDILKARRDRVARDYPACRMFRRLSDMLDETGIDLVDIATCSTDHVRHAMASLQKGFWTLLETPMALTLADAQILRGQAMKSRDRLIVAHRGLFAPDFLLAQQVAADPRLGRLYDVRIRKEDFVRRDDWQCVKRLGGGAAYYAMPDLVLQALRLLPSPPVQMWSELKRIASLGDSEDYVHVCLKTREAVTADIEFSGGAIPGIRAPSFEIRGELGVFRVAAGESQGTITFIDPNFTFPRRRSSVRTPPFKNLHEQFPVLEEKVSLPDGTQCGPAAFWQRIYNVVRTAEPFPLQLDESIETVKFSQLMKKTSPYGK